MGVRVNGLITGQNKKDFSDGGSLAVDLNSLLLNIGIQGGLQIFHVIGRGNDGVAEGVKDTGGTIVALVLLIGRTAHNGRSYSSVDVSTIHPKTKRGKGNFIPLPR
jgi:hypothetical protein